MRFCVIRVLFVLMFVCSGLPQRFPSRNPSSGEDLIQLQNTTDMGTPVNIADSFLLRSLQQGDANAFDQISQLRHSVTSPLEALFSARGPNRASNLFHLWHTMAIARGLLPNTVASLPTAAVSAQSRSSFASRTVLTPRPPTMATTASPVLRLFSRSRHRGVPNIRRLQHERSQTRNMPIRTTQEQHRRGHLNNNPTNFSRDTSFAVENSHPFHSRTQPRLDQGRAISRIQRPVHGSFQNRRHNIPGTIHESESIAAETKKRPLSANRLETMNEPLVNSTATNTIRMVVTKSPVRTLQETISNSVVTNTGTSTQSTAVTGSEPRDMLIEHVLQQLNSGTETMTNPNIVVTSVVGLDDNVSHVQRNTTDHTRSIFESRNTQQTDISNNSRIDMMVSAHRVTVSNATPLTPIRVTRQPSSTIIPKTRVSIISDNTLQNAVDTRGSRLVDVKVVANRISMPLYDFVLQNVSDIVTKHGLVRPEYNEQYVGDTVRSLGIRQSPMLPVVTDRFHPKAEIVQPKSREEKVGDGKGVVIKYVGDITMDKGEDVVLQYIGDIVTRNGISNLLVPVNVSGNGTAAPETGQSGVSNVTRVILDGNTHTVFDNINGSNTLLGMNITAQSTKGSGIPAFVTGRPTTFTKNPVFDGSNLETGTFIGVGKNGMLNKIHDISNFLGFRGFNIHALDLTTKGIEFPVLLMQLFNNKQDNTNWKNTQSNAEGNTTVQMSLVQNEINKPPKDFNSRDMTGSRSTPRVISTNEQIKMWLGLDHVTQQKLEGKSKTENKTNTQRDTQSPRQRVKVLHASFG